MCRFWKKIVAENVEGWEETIHWGRRWQKVIREDNNKDFKKLNHLGIWFVREGWKRWWSCQVIIKRPS